MTKIEFTNLSIGFETLQKIGTEPNTKIQTAMKSCIIFQGGVYFFVALDINIQQFIVLTSLIFRQLWKLFIKFLDSLDFKVSQRLDLWFYTSKLILFCSPRHKLLKISNCQISALCLRESVHNDMYYFWLFKSSISKIWDLITKFYYLNIFFI